MTPEQLHQIDQARRYAEQDEYVVTRTHIRNLLAIIEWLDDAGSSADCQFCGDPVTGGCSCED